jgi:Protein of unknown function (DUF935)
MPTTAPQSREIASIKGRRDITRGYLGALLYPQDSILKIRGYNYEIYEEILRDDQVKAVFQQRRSAVISTEWEVTPGGDSRQDKKAADFIRDLLPKIGWDNICDKHLHGVHYGFSVAECMFGRTPEGLVSIDSIRVRKQRRFRFDWEQKPRLLTWDNYLEGEELPEKKFWSYSTGADNDDEPYGLGLAHWLYWPVFFKREGVRSWLKFLERFAIPTSKGTYSVGATAEEKAALKEALLAFGEDAAMMIPEGVAIELIEASRSGTADYSVLCDRMDGAIAKIILSQTMTTDNGSSMSQAQVHNGVKLEVVKADADLLDSSAAKTWVTWLTNWNFPGAAIPSLSRKLETPESLNDRAARDEKLSALGFRLTPEKVLEIYGDGYYDPSQVEKESGDAPPLVSILGVGGTEALVGFIQQLSQSGLKKANAISTLMTVFGISEEAAQSMVPDDEPIDATPAEPAATIDQAASLFSESSPPNPRAYAVLQALDRLADSGFEEVAIDFSEPPDPVLFSVLQALDRALDLPSINLEDLF